MRLSRFIRVPTPFALVLPLVLLILAGCASSATGGIPTTGATPSPTVTPSPTATRSPLAQCQAALSGAGPASAGASFSDVPFPSGTLTTVRLTSRGGDGRFLIVQEDACTPSSTASDIQTYYATRMLAQGWAQATTYPYDGGYQASCGDPYCWHKDTAPRYVSLESVTTVGAIARYHLRFAIPPTPPSCTPDSIGIYATRAYETTLDNTPAPAPPLTKAGLGSGGSAGSVTSGGFSGMCSAGSATALDAFFNAELPAHGWTYGTLPAALSGCGTGSHWWKGNNTFSWQTNGSAGASGVFWGYGYCIER
ncbi:MAG: hypothetical protein IVW57_07660 [Ktedonobacterales bacterium]|nr:hypothetical protein [Ktedonobacterales bacterium]